MFIYFRRNLLNLFVEKMSETDAIKIDNDGTEEKKGGENPQLNLIVS